MKEKFGQSQGKTNYFLGLFVWVAVNVFGLAINGDKLLAILNICKQVTWSVMKRGFSERVSAENMANLASVIAQSHRVLGRMRVST